LTTLWSAPPKHLVESFGSSVKSRECGLVLFYSARLRRYRHTFSDPEKKLVEQCQKTLFPKKILWFKSVTSEFRFGYPKNYMATQGRFSSIGAGTWWFGRVPSLRPLGDRLKKEAGIKGLADSGAGSWRKLPAFRIMVNEVSAKEYAKRALGHGGAPKVNISFTGARAFCKKMGGDLPSEEQWEIAARGGEYFLVFSWGESIPYACFRRSGPQCGTIKQSSDVSLWGVRNLSSSVAEWVLGAKEHLGTTGKAVVKGGGDSSHWYYNLIPSYQVVPPSTRAKNIGFRCVFPPSP
ncbi:formylglycine-generating enzyme family protein, partial [Myxococcota bacterium]|nr:formylglycine-generating enzyme family protein [Myxococcota bacterium]